MIYENAGDLLEPGEQSTNPLGVGGEQVCMKV